MSSLPVGVVGGGIVGLAVARELLQRRPGLKVVLFEKEPVLGAHQTGHNSGVVHAGIYYKPGSLKARLCTRGRALLREFCTERGIPYIECGKLVVAIHQGELARLDALEKNAIANRVPGLRRVDGGEIASIEPHAVGHSALHSPATAITDFSAVADMMAADITAAGGSVQVSTAVTKIRHSGAAIEVRAGDSTRLLSGLILCAGLNADRVAHMADGKDEPRIVPFRGEYMNVVNSKQDLVRGLIYPVPDPRYPFLGVHFTRRVSGGLEVGPNAVLALKREGYRRRDVNLEDAWSTLTWPGFWRMARTHWRTGVREMRGSLSVRAYMRAARRYVPEISASDVVRCGAGVRAQAVGRDGSLIDDFLISRSGGIVSVRNAPSPAATSSLAIAEHVVDTVLAAS